MKVYAGQRSWRSTAHEKYVYLYISTRLVLATDGEGPASVSCDALTRMRIITQHESVSLRLQKRLHEKISTLDHFSMPDVDGSKARNCRSWLHGKISTLDYSSTPDEEMEAKQGIADLS